MDESMHKVLWRTWTVMTFLSILLALRDRACAASRTGAFREREAWICDALVGDGE